MTTLPGLQRSFFPPPVSPVLATLAATLALAGGCATPEQYAAEADADAYGILEQAARSVTGSAKTFDIERPVDSLRKRLIESPKPLTLDLKSTLDVAAENSRDFQASKETLYRAALALTSQQYDFETRFGSITSADINGQDDTTAQVTFREALSASVNTTSGGRLVASFTSTFLRSVIGNGSLNGTSILGLSFSQPLLRGFGARIVREDLTQSERDVVYAMRSFERARSGLAVRIVQDYYNILSLTDNLKNTRLNYESLVRDRIRMVDIVKANRQRAEDLDQAKQRELVAENSVLRTKVQLASAYDRFNITLGLPTATKLTLDPEEFKRIEAIEVGSDKVDENNLIAYALKHRMDYRTVRDQQSDAARGILVAEDALRSQLDFGAALTVPTEGSSKPFNIDWDKVSWAAGFDLDLALERLPQRNAYRRALITYAAAVRDTEDFTDQIAADIRDTLRTLENLEKSYKINQAAVALAQRRVDRTEAFMLAGGRAGTQTRDVLEAKDDLLAAQLDLTGSAVDYAVAKLQLLRDIEALDLEPKGLRYDPGLKLPNEAVNPPTARPDEKNNTEEKK